MTISNSCISLDAVPLRRWLLDKLQTGAWTHLLAVAMAATHVGIRN